MNKSGYIRVLNDFRPCLRLIKSCNPNNFRELRNWRSIPFSILFNAFIATMTVLTIPIYHVLGFWYLFESEVSLTNFAISLPILITFAQLETTFVELMRKNDVIDATIKRLQQLIDIRESCFG